MEQLRKGTGAERAANASPPRSGGKAQARSGGRPQTAGSARRPDKQKRQTAEPAQRPSGKAPKPAQTARPAQRPNGKAPRSAQPAQPVQLAKPAKPVQLTKPAQPSKPMQPAQRPEAQIRYSAAAQPMPIPQSAPAAPAKPKKQRAEKIKVKKNKDPNRIRILSFEGRVDIPMLIITLVLLAFGMTMMFSASHAYSYLDFKGDSYAYITRQMVAAGIGLAGMIFIPLLDYRFLRRESKRMHITVAHVFLGFCVVINGYCGFFGIQADGGQKRWLQLPLFGQFQPSDFLKIAVVIFMAYYIHKNADRLRLFFYGLMKPILWMILPILSILVQKHLSCLIIILLLIAIMLFVGGVNMKEALPVAGVVIFIAYLAIFVFKLGYFDQRIEYMDPLSEPEDRSYQNYQSALAVGSGGFWGKGFGNSCQKYYYLPEAQNDFVFAILVEEFGFVGGVLVMLLFIIFVMRGLYIARKAEDKFGCLLATGITVQIGLQALLNIGVNLCCIPNTGVSLPFFSYGGTALVLQLWEMGLLLAISKRAKVK